jgi:8-oxo-dGTP pyrophosphatase MutT (NUDIX family)
MIAFDPSLRASIVSNIARHEVRAVPVDDRHRAAVAIVIVDTGADTGAGTVEPWPDMTGVPGDLTGFDGHMEGVGGGASFLLCRRAARLHRHAGQWALPGGRTDTGESPEQAALRELEEELGLSLPESEVLGRLDDYPTRSGFVITPVVVWGGPRPELHPDPAEVARVVHVGLHELCRADSPRFVDIPESDRPVVQLPVGRDLIHAPTGAMLLQFRWVALEGKAGSRVHHYDQPVFAWR